MTDDVDTLRVALADVADASRSLPWARQRPWRADTHVRWEGDVPVIDLHDLNVKWALAAVTVLDALELSSPEVWVITGRGRHTGGISPLRQAVGGKLGSLAEAHDWHIYPDGPGRIRVVRDSDRGRARRAPSLLMVFFAVALTAGLYATWAPLAVLPTLVAIVLWWRR